MEIIKAGEVPAHFWHHGTCDVCSTEVRFTREEAEVSDGIYGEDPDVLHIQCPLCKNWIKAVD